MRSWKYSSCILNCTDWWGNFTFPNSESKPYSDWLRVFSLSLKIYLPLDNTQYSNPNKCQIKKLFFAGAPTMIGEAVSILSGACARLWQPTYQHTMTTTGSLQYFWLSRNPRYVCGWWANWAASAKKDWQKGRMEISNPFCSLGACTLFATLIFLLS